METRGVLALEWSGRRLWVSSVIDTLRKGTGWLVSVESTSTSIQQCFSQFKNLHVLFSTYLVIRNPSCSVMTGSTLTQGGN